jgi:hypothetical protein
MCHHWLLDMRMLDLLTAMGKPPFVVVDLQKKVAWFPVIARERERGPSSCQQKTERKRLGLEKGAKN